jgi:hypothetical protein
VDENKETEMNDYLQQILSGQAQRKIAGQGAFTGSQIEAAFQGDIAARYQAESSNRALALSEKSEAARESEFTASQAQSQSQFTASQAQQASEYGQSLAYQQQQLASQEKLGQTQAVISGVGSAASLALGTAALGKTFPGLFGGTPKVVPPVTDAGAAAGTAAYTGAAAEGTAAAAGVEATVAGSEEAAAALSASYAGEYVGAATLAGGTTAAVGEAAVAGEVLPQFVEGIAAAIAAWVLCSELVRQGKLDAEIVDDEWSYIKQIITYQEYMGYRVIADPLVNLMQKSKLFTLFMTPLIRGFAYEMASRVNPEIEGSKLGKFILWFGRPLCRICAPETIRVEV